MAQDNAQADDGLTVERSNERQAAVAADLKAARQRVADAEKALKALEKEDAK